MAQLLAEIEIGAEFTFSVAYAGDLRGRTFYATIKQYVGDETALATITEADGISWEYDGYDDTTTIYISLYSTVTALFPPGLVYFGLWAVDPNNPRTDVDVVTGSMNAQWVSK